MTTFGIGRHDPKRVFGIEEGGHGGGERGRHMVRCFCFLFFVSLPPSSHGGSASRTDIDDNAAGGAGGSGNWKDDDDDDNNAKEWDYIRLEGLGFVPGLCCPHHDRVQSNGILRATDFDVMMLQHPTEVGVFSLFFREL